VRLKIDPEFSALIRPLDADEKQRMENSLESDGCRDALIVWKEEGILLDGHNRYSICEDAGIKYDVKEMSFPDRESAFRWIIANQLARRNLSPEERKYLVGKKFKSEEKTRGGDRKSKGQNEPLIGNTAERIGKEFGVSASTVKRAAKFAEAVDALPAAEKADVLAGKKQIPTQHKKNDSGEFKRLRGNDQDSLDYFSILGEMEEKLYSLVKLKPLAHFRKRALDTLCKLRRKIEKECERLNA
jgi:hypothetical protein